MPSGEIVTSETLENEYLCDGWSKELSHIIVSSTNADTTIEIKHIVCEERTAK